MKWTWLVVAAVLLAGCSDGGKPALQEDDPFGDLDDDVASDKGLIRGIVIDATITPIEGATVALQDGSAQTKTNSDGAFVLKDLDPGTYFLTVTKPGYAEIQQSSEVKAGVQQPPIVKIQLTRLPGTEPHVQTFQDVGFIACGWGIPIRYGYCGSYFGEEDDFRLQYEVYGKPSYIQVEVVWENTQPLSANLYMINAICPPADHDICPGGTETDPDEAPYRWDEGTWTSPAVMRSPSGYMDRALAYHGMENMDGWTVGVDVSADGPALATGVTIDQEFSGYVTIFWNIEPPEDWAFHKDGEYVVPQ